MAYRTPTGLGAKDHPKAARSQYADTLSLFDDVGPNEPSEATLKPAPPSTVPATSTQAAEAAAPNAERIRVLCLEKYEAAGDRGLTADECAAALGLDVLSVRPRITELKIDGFLEPNGESRRTTDFGRKSRVLVSTEEGQNG